MYTVESDRYLTIVNRTASILLFLPFPDLVHHPIITQNFKGTIKTALFTEGLSHPTSVAFVDSATILVAEKDSGKIRKISGGVLEDESVLRVNVNSTGELGLLGIAVLNKERQESTDIITDCNCSVFIYFTQDNDNGNNNNPRNVIYKYDWDGESLTNPKLLVDLPAPPYHDSGKLRIGPDNQLYAVIGDLASPNSIQQNSILSNCIDNNDLSLTNNSSSVIIRIDPDNGFPLSQTRLEWYSYTLIFPVEYELRKKHFLILPQGIL